MKNSKILLSAIFVVLVVGASAFFAGMQFQKRKVPTLRNLQSMREQFGTGNGPQVQVFGERLQGQGKAISGEIIAQDEKSITVKLSDGSSRIIFVGDSVQINKIGSGSKDDLSKGVQVFVVGSENSDGSITAQNIQINPVF